MYNSLTPPGPPPQSPINFAAIKGQVLDAINDRLRMNILPPDPKGYGLIDGIINMPLQQELRGVVLGGPAIPTVAIVGNSTGLVFTFALKALLPNLIL